MPALIVASGNPGKVGECAALLAVAGLTVLGLDAIPPGPAVEETGSTFEENAMLKAQGYSARTPHVVLADDSGLEVDALGGAPGVLSARYGGPDLTDPQRCVALLKAMSGIPADRRTARFRCVLALAQGGRTLLTVEGAVEGTILFEPRGDNGFGYDPIFFHPPSDRGFAELTRAQKELVSHRGQALRKLLDALRRKEAS